MNKRGLSNIVATLIILLLVIVAAGIIWVVVRNVIQSNAEEIALGKFIVDVEIKNVEIDNSSNNVSVNVKRNSGKGELSGIKFIFYDGTNSEIITEEITLKELESRRFNFHLINLNVDNLITISIALVFKSDSGKEIIGNIVDVYDMRRGGICIANCTGKECGSDGCGGICGTCEVGYHCGLGICIEGVNPCQLTSASWNETNVVEGTLVSLNVVGTDCTGIDLNYSIYEDDLVGDDFITSFVATNLSTTWITQWVDDGLAGDPEYYFIVRVVDNPTEEITSGAPLLTVTQGCIITCTTEPGCRSSLENGQVVGGECCSTGNCYNCETGYSWNGSACVAAGCTPATCTSLGYECGTWANGTCAGTLNCGTCGLHATCLSGTCICDSGWGDCNNDNICECDLSSNSCVGGSCVVGNIITALSCSQADVQAAINLAVDGDTVSVPAGWCTWTGNVIIPSTKGISLIGAGIGNTNIALNGNYLALNTRPTNSRVRVSGFSFINTTESCFRINDDYAIGATDWRVDNCEWTGTTVLGAKISVRGYTFGVFDNCIFNEQGRIFFIDTRTEPFDTGGYPGPIPFPGGYSWTQPLDMGGPSAVYIENNTIINTAYSIIFNCRGGARTVFRNNLMIGFNSFETHSGCSNGFRNPRWIEIYNNIFTGTGGTAFFIRSTNGMIYNNSVPSTFSGVLTFDYEFPCYRPTPCVNPPWEPYTNEGYWSTYPAQDQIGAGRDSGFGTPQALDEAKLYAWNNIRGGSLQEPSFPSCAAAQLLIQNNRDYWRQITPFTGASGIGVGLLSGRPSFGLTIGVYYWANDTNTLYRATSPTEWEIYYTPYTYPHPLRGE